MQQNKKNIKVIISGGGTGGHIYPAIAIANALKKIDNQISILFIGAKGKMEMQKVPAAGYSIEGLWISGFQRKLTIKNLMIPFKIFASMIKALTIIRKFQPDVIVGVGGYASGPALRAAQLSHIPSLIQEQNSFPGITNKLLAKNVNSICVAYEGMERFFPKEKIVLTGNPVRQDISQLEEKRSDALKYFQLAAEKKVLVVLGGSLGARAINATMQKKIKSFIEQDIQVIWQIGKIYFDQYKDEMSALSSKGVRVFDFIDRMDYAYAVADVVVSRAGAISISEVCVAGKPAIIIPSPNVAEDHQTKNAQALVQNNAALMLTDDEANEQLDQVVLSLMTDEKKRNMLSQNIKRMAFMDSAERIAKEIIRLSEKK